MIASRSGGAIVALASVVALTGCITFDGPVTISSLDGELRVAVCKDITVDGAYGSYRLPDDEWNRAWEASGRVAIPAGTVSTLEGDGFGLQTSLSSIPELSPGSRLSLTFLTDPDANSGALADFTIPDSGWVDGVWLTPNGDLRALPCDEDEAQPQE